MIWHWREIAYVAVAVGSVLVAAGLTVCTLMLTYVKQHLQDLWSSQLKDSRDVIAEGIVGGGLSLIGIAVFVYGTAELLKSRRTSRRSAESHDWSTLPCQRHNSDSR